jgi:flagellar assembly factor FliW
MAQMLRSSLFGDITYDLDELYIFEEGIPGFPHLREFLFIKLEDSPFTVMHSIKEDTYFFLIDPFERYANYEFPLDELAKKKLGIEEREDVFCYAIVVLREPLADSTANLSAPIVINTKTRKAMQLMLDQSPYSIRTLLFTDVKEREVEQKR